MVITSKHHDGFAMYDSDVDPGYNIADATAWRHDTMKDLKAACTRQGIRFGFYYSQAWDWGHPDGPGNAVPFEGYCDMATDGGGWTLLVWTSHSSNIQPYGVPYPGNVLCPAFDCTRGSGVPPKALDALFSISTEFGWGQSVDAEFLKPRLDPLGSSQ
jgi:hypothetical protein